VAVVERRVRHGLLPWLAMSGISRIVAPGDESLPRGCLWKYQHADAGGIREKPKRTNT
jgi:hypothetical protein